LRGKLGLRSAVQLRVQQTSPSPSLDPRCCALLRWTDETTWSLRFVMQPPQTSKPWWS
jgi:hypothetical protein